MTWIKRNVFFVLGLFAGVALTGYCGWMFYQNLGKVAKAATDYQSESDQLGVLLKAPNYPSDGNIQVATEDQRQITELLDRFHGAMHSLPPPPKEDDQGFLSYLRQTVTELGTAATDAGVELPEDFAFTFTAQLTNLNHPVENIRPWIEQLGEIKVICGILFEAKINSMVSLQRVRVSPSDDGPSSDYFGAEVVTNAPEIFTPYKLSFRGYSQDVAEVLRGLARSSNFIRIKAIQVRHDTEGNVAPHVTLAEPTGGSGEGLAARPKIGESEPAIAAELMAGRADVLVARPMFVRNEGGGRGGGGGGRGGGGRGGGGSGGGGSGGTQTGAPANGSGAPSTSAGSGGGSTAPARPPARAGGPVAGRGGAASGGPPTVLSEGLLRVSLSVEVVKLSGGGR